MLLAFDVGYKATGWCWTSGVVTHLLAGGPGQLLVESGVIVPTTGVSPKLLNDKRKCDAAVPQIEKLFDGIRKILCSANIADAQRHDPAIFKGGAPIPFYVIAEVPSMGSQNAGSAREMAMALATFVTALRAELPLASVERYLRSDVIAAMYGSRPPKKPADKKKAKGFMKRETAKVVAERMLLDFDRDYPPEESQMEHAFDAAACLFAARDAPSVRSQRWSEEAMNCLRMAGR